MSDLATCLNGDLLCTEDATRLEEEEDDDEDDRFVFLMSRSAASDSEEYIRFLFSRERSFGDFGHAGGGDSLMRARSAAVRWILQARIRLRFSLQCAYVSVTYLDRFLLRRTIDSNQPWIMDLLSLACLSLAAKMEEIKVPPLPQFPAKNNYHGKSVLRMELLVLNTLEWRMSQATPFVFLGFFAYKLAGELASKELLRRAVDFIFAAIEGTNLVDFRPSAVAAAAIFAASGSPPTEKSMNQGMPIIESPELDQILSCYEIMIQAGASPGVGVKRKRLHLSNGSDL
ncbi:cyclin-D5-2-like [Wolffia australiana]